MTIEPDVGVITVESMRRVVVFPAPFGPSNENISPGLHSKLMSFTAKAKWSFVFRSLRCSLFKENFLERSSTLIIIV